MKILSLNSVCPLEVATVILTHLDLVQIGKCSRVSKIWQSYVCYFIDHPNEFPFSDEQEQQMKRLRDKIKSLYLFKFRVLFYSISSWPVQMKNIYSEWYREKILKRELYINIVSENEKNPKIISIRKNLNELTTYEHSIFSSRTERNIRDELKELLNSDFIVLKKTHWIRQAGNTTNPIRYSSVKLPLLSIENRWILAKLFGEAAFRYMEKRKFDLALGIINNIEDETIKNPLHTFIKEQQQNSNLKK